MEPIAQVNDVSKRYGSHVAVDALSFSIAAGEAVGFLGPNGAGKTTTMRMMVALAQPSSGTISLFGRPVASDFASVASRVGAVVSAPAFYSHLTARANLRILARCAGVDESRTRLEGLLDLVGLSGVVNRRVRGFSSGMLRRLSVAGALIADPDLIILDEPTAGLDPVGVRDFRDVVANVMRKRPGRSLLLSSHQLSDAEVLCDRVVLIREGRLVRQGAVEELVGGEGATVTLSLRNVRLAQQVLRRAEVPCRAEVDSVVVDEQNLATALRSLARRNLHPDRVEPSRRTLEDVFFET